MPRMVEFDLLNSPLAGTNLIEASAGTGKTYTIAGLILRLVLELDVSLSEILVVTYTEAATSELKDRVRRRLREALEAFSGRTAADPFLSALLEKHLDRSAALKKLELAINDFDRASIFTIHGFCLRALQDHAFASGIQFDTELVTTEEIFRREIVYDFWRKHFYSASPLFYKYARRMMGLDLLFEIAKKTVGGTNMKVVPEEAPLDCSPHEAEYTRLFDRLCLAWGPARSGVEKVFTSSPALNGAKYRKDYIPAWLASMDGFLTGECLECVPFPQFDKFCSTTIAGSLKKGQSAPSHPFFDLCEAFKKAQQVLVAAYDRRILSLKISLLDQLKTELQARKLRKNILFFDDLLTKLDNALHGPTGDGLCATIKTKFKAALIDEFQDTDSIQYSIFKKVFGAPPSILFLIGDPKQAIYGFRGADIFTYMEACSNASSRFTLSENWRSDRSLISAVNTVFANSANPFVFSEIPFLPAASARGKEPELLTIEGEPLQIWYLRSEEPAGSAEPADGPVGKEKARNLIARSVAAEISRLIAMGREGKGLIGKRPLREGDIAVLVRKNREGQLVQQALTCLRIHSVLFNMGNLFDSREAKEVQAVLAAVANPSEERLLRTALATDMMGVGGEELDRLGLDDEGWDQWLLTFSRYHETWAKYGFFRMFRRLLFQQEVVPRLMALPDGERRCTNILHLSEVIHKASVENNFNMFGTIKWLSAQRDKSTPRIDEHQLRLESDENAVKIVTIHKSKGLEYPIVFCPFAWCESTLRDFGGQPFFTFHDLSLDGKPPTLDLGSADLARNKGWAEREQLAENLRLLYVAMTRAKHRCYVVWGRIKEAGTSAPAYLFHPSTPDECDERIDSLKVRIDAKDDGALMEDLERLREKSKGAICLCPMPDGGDAAQLPVEVESTDLSACSFDGKIDSTWRISSFSSLTFGAFGKPHKAELADYDEEAAAPPSPPGEESEEPFREGQEHDMAAFPRGAAAGILFHEIFQRLDFASTDGSAVRELVSAKLVEHGFDPLWQEPVRGMIRRVLDTPLNSPYGSFTLSQIETSRKMSEMEFYFPLQRLDGVRLKEALSRNVRGRASGLDASVDFERMRLESVAGFFKGFIDTVFEFGGRFYIVDWKSSYLGPTVEHYNQEALEKAVRDNLYTLQYYLYTVALHQYLKVRLPGYSYEEHFGEVIYVFLRGVEPSAGSRLGIYRDRPSLSSIEALCASLIAQEGR